MYRITMNYIYSRDVFSQLHRSSGYYSTTVLSLNFPFSIFENWSLFNIVFWFLSFCCIFAVNVGEDCPVFDGLYEFCQLSTGGSVGN